MGVNGEGFFQEICQVNHLRLVEARIKRQSNAFIQCLRSAHRLRKLQFEFFDQDREEFLKTLKIPPNLTSLTITEMGTSRDMMKYAGKLIQTLNGIPKISDLELNLQVEERSHIKA